MRLLALKFFFLLLSFLLGVVNLLASPTSQELQSDSPRPIQFGGNYDELDPRQREMVDKWFDEYNQIMGENRDPEDGDPGPPVQLLDPGPESDEPGQGDQQPQGMLCKHDEHTGQTVEGLSQKGIKRPQKRRQNNGKRPHVGPG